MPLLPHSFRRILSSLSTRKDSNITLFDDLPKSEKDAAIVKLQHLAEKQPGPRRKFHWKRPIMVFTGILSVVAIVIGATALAAAEVDPELIQKLRMANTNMDRMKLLPKNEDWFFDFTKQDKYNFAPGATINADASSFPATIGNGMTMAMLNLGACNMQPPHYHPRASNYVLAIKGTTRTYMIAENGARLVEQTLEPGQMTIMPAGSVHAMMNIGCDDAQLVAALNSDDSGTTNLANTFFMMPQNFTQTILGSGVNVEALEDNVPDIMGGSIWGPEACRAACAAKGKMVKRTW